MNARRAPADATAKGPAYQGQAGVTRIESLHLRQTGGTLRTVEVYRVVNVATHPELRQRVLGAQLHRQADGSELALPFVYHDPELFKFALVIPPALAHLELKERAKLMSELAEDPHPVPQYVRDGITVLGTAELQQFLTGQAAVASGPSNEPFGRPRQTVRSSSGDSPAHAVEGRSAASRIVAGVSQLFGQAGKRTRGEAKGSAGVAIRRLSGTPAPVRHPALARLAALPRVAPELDSEAVVDSERSLSPASRALRARSGVGAVELEIADTADIADRLGASQQAAVTANSGVASRQNQRSVAAHAPALADVFSPSAETLPAQLAKRSPRRKSQPARDPAVLEMQLALAPDELTLYVQLDTQRADVYDDEAELLIQLTTIDERPVVLLTLLGARDAVARAALDGLAPATQRLLGRLEHDFRARLVLRVGREQRGTRSILAPREANAAAIGARIQAARNEPAIAAHAAIDRALAEPPPDVRADELPFGPARLKAASTASVLTAVEQLSTWQQPERLEQALIVHSVPKHVIEAWRRRVLLSARSFGIALPEALVELAVDNQLASDKPAFVRTQMHAFRQRVERGQNDLGLADTTRNWEQLVSQAKAFDVNVEADISLPKPPRAKSAQLPPVLIIENMECRHASD
jgi:hypothetical protein